MGYIPRDSKWYVAYIVEQIRVQGDSRNVVHTNQTLIRAGSPGEAYHKAIALGKQGNTRYKNPDGKVVTIRFRGLRQLSVIYDELEHGAEIDFSREVAVSEKKIRNWIRSKKKLDVFAPIRPHKGSDYSSAEVMEEVWKRLPLLKRVRGPAYPGYRKTSKRHSK